MGRYALLVGISNYTHLKPLPSAVKDVDALRQVLINPQIGGFAESDVLVLMDAEKGAIETAIYHLFANRKTNDLLLFYFSGHGVTDSRSDFYFTGLTTQKDILPPTAVTSDYVHKAMNQSRSKYQVVILDCCHSGAFSKGMTAKDGGTVQVLPKLGGEGRAILTASDSTQYAFEQEGFELSLYTHFLVEGLKTGAADWDEDGDVSVDELYEYVRDQVKSVNDLMSPEIYPVREGHKIILAKAIKGKYPANAFMQEEFKDYAKDLGSQVEDIPEIQNRYRQDQKYSFSPRLISRRNLLIVGLTGGGFLGVLALGNINTPIDKNLISRDSKSTSASILTTSTTYDLGNGITLELVNLPAGKFMMGSNEFDTEKPIHEVTISAFSIGKYAVTNDQWKMVMGTEPSKQYEIKFQGSKQPVIGVSWDNCRSFCERLSSKLGKDIRLPSEAEWEYACRAGTQTKYYFGDEINQLDAYAWYRDNSGGQTHLVGEKNSNQFGLYDMHGNIWEWCSDRWHKNYNNAPKNGSSWETGAVDNIRVLRGGSWNNDASNCRSANRDGDNADSRSSNIGFRLVVS